jgi:hypothetical protein
VVGATVVGTTVGVGATVVGATVVGTAVCVGLAECVGRGAFRCVGFGVGLGDTLEEAGVGLDWMCFTGWPAECALALPQPVNTAAAPRMNAATAAPRTCGHGKVNLLLKTVPPTECADVLSAPQDAA